MTVRSVLPVLLVVINVLLSSCGFHLRSYDIDQSVGSVEVESIDTHVLADPLTKALRQAGVANELAADEKSDITIALLNQRRDRRGLSVTGRARVSEYEVALEVQYSIRRQDGNTLVEPTWIRSERVYKVDRDNLLGNSEEQALLEREMQDDLLRQIMTALSTVTRTSV